MFQTLTKVAKCNQISTELWPNVGTRSSKLAMLTSVGRPLAIRLSENVACGAVQKRANIVELEKCCAISIYMQ